jgi:hypothetical protein
MQIHTQIEPEEEQAWQARLPCPKGEGAAKMSLTFDVSRSESTISLLYIQGHHCTGHRVEQQ